MATNGAGPQQAFTPVLAAMSTMRDGQREQKLAAHKFLETFQKSVGQRTGDGVPTLQAFIKLTVFTDGRLADYNRDSAVPR